MAAPRKPRKAVARKRKAGAEWSARKHLQSLRPEVREYYRREPERKSWRWWETRLLNLTRKLEPYERLAVQLFAGSLASERIKLRLTRSAPRSRYGSADIDKYLGEIFDAIDPAAEKLASLARKASAANDPGGKEARHAQ